MRRQDKYRNMEQANLMLENSYLKRKGLLKEEENPESITIELTDKYKNKMKEIKGFEGSTGYASGVTPLTLPSKDDAAVCIGSYPFDMMDGKMRQQFEYASYRPEIDEIQVNVVTCFGNDMIEKHQNVLEKGYAFSLRAPLFNMGNFPEDNSCQLNSGYYSKFNNGFQVGEEGEEGYFKIVGVK